MKQPKVILHRLSELRLHRENSDYTLVVPHQRCRIVKNSGWIAEFGYFHFIAQVLYNSRNGSSKGQASLVFAGSKPVVVCRDLASSKVRVEIDGVDTPLAEGQEPGDFLFGLSQQRFEETVLVDGREFILPKGPESLQAHVAAVMTPQTTKANKSPELVAEDLQTVRSKRIALEKQLQVMPMPKVTKVEPVDPPSMGELFRSLEQSREVEKRLIERRIALTEEFKKTSKLSERQLTPATAPILSELENLAAVIEENENATSEIRANLDQQGSFLAKASVIISLMISAGAAAIGNILEETLLTEIAVGLAGFALITVIGIWLARMNRIIASTRQAKTLRAKRSKLREKASKLCMRVGTAASAEDLSPESIRTLVDRIGKRDTGRMIQEALAPFIDTDAELSTVKKLAQALESPLTEAAEIRDKNLPAVPLVRVTRAAMEVLADWSAALGETSKRIEDATVERTRVLVERELVEQSLERMRVTEQTLALNTPRPQNPKSDPRVRAAQFLNRSIVPILARYLGRSAPRKFTDDLYPVFDAQPSSSTNSFIALVIRLLSPKRQQCAVGTIVVDLGIAAGPSWEQQLGRLLCQSPTFGSLTVMHRSQQVEEGFLKAMGLEALGAIGVTDSNPVMQMTPGAVDSRYNHTATPVAGAPDRLLEPASH